MKHFATEHEVDKQTKNTEVPYKMNIVKVDPFDKVNPSKSNPVLVISGRENDIRVITGNMKSRLGFVKKHLVSKYIILVFCQYVYSRRYSGL